ncbi:MAG: hypothetical protein ACKOWJ_01950 [Micrococcales bacterium]
MLCAACTTSCPVFWTDGQYFGGFVAAVEDEAVGVDDCGRAEVLAIGPENWAAGGAGGTEDALGGVFEALAVFGAL